MERDAQADDEEVERVLEVRLQLSHDDEDEEVEQDVHLSRKSADQLRAQLVTTSASKVLEYKYTSDESYFSPPLRAQIEYTQVESCHEISDKSP